MLNNAQPVRYCPGYLVPRVRDVTVDVRRAGGVFTRALVDGHREANGWGLFHVHGL
jgi:hypothetical protein